MSVLVCPSNAIPAAASYDRWFATTGTRAGLDPALRVADIAERLEAAFLAERETWWRIGRAHQSGPGAAFAHMPTCGAFGSDFGVMLAWGRVVEELQASDDDTLCICDDPFLRAYLIERLGGRGRPGWAGFGMVAGLALRGVLARTRVAWRTAIAALSMRSQREPVTDAMAVLLVYGHPESDAEGFDAYFGRLLVDFPAAARLLHTDCPPDTARALGVDGRTASLHGWGSPLFALGALFCVWRPRAEGPERHLIRRAAAIENGGGGPAMNRWQHHCQQRFLRHVRPRTVVWPWENHGWERTFIRAARALGVRTVGYQHTVIGPFQINYSARANADGAASLPDVIAADGPAYLEELRAWDVPDDRLIDAGALRMTPLEPITHDRDAPVLVLLSAIQAAAATQLAAAAALAAAGWRVLVKVHPMYDVDIPHTDTLQRTDMPLRRFERLAGVLYSSGASGVEARLSGLPALRILFDDRIAIDVLPAGLSNPTATPDTVVARFRDLRPPPPAAWDSIFSEPRPEVWRSLLSDDTNAPDSPEQQQ